MKIIKKVNAWDVCVLVGCCSGGRAGRPVREKKHFISIIIVYYYYNTIIIGLIVNVIHDYPNLPIYRQDVLTAFLKWTYYDFPYFCLYTVKLKIMRSACVMQTVPMVKELIAPRTLF